MATIYVFHNKKIYILILIHLLILIPDQINFQLNFFVERRKAVLVLLQLGLGLVVVCMVITKIVRRFHEIFVKNFMFFFIDKRWIYAVNKNFTVFFWEDDIFVL